MTFLTRANLIRIILISTAICIAIISAYLPSGPSHIPTAKAGCTWGYVGSFSSSGDLGFGTCGDPDCGADSGSYAGTCYSRADEHRCEIYSFTCTPDVCPVGQIGTPPSCHAPTCADTPSMDGCSCSKSNGCNTTTGTLSGGSCTAATPAACPTVTCADLGMLGSYPSCYTPAPPTCADYGQLGTYPSCYTPAAPTCADSGQLGTYPSCYTPAAPTCADSGQTGTYPACSPIVVPPSGCTSPTVTIAANPNRISSGGSTALTVTATGITTSCTVTGPGVNTTITASACTANNSSIPTGTLTSQTTYTVSCDSGAVINKVIVNVNPVFKPF